MVKNDLFVLSSLSLTHSQENRYRIESCGWPLLLDNSHEIVGLTTTEKKGWPFLPGWPVLPGLPLLEKNRKVVLNKEMGT